MNYSHYDKRYQQILSYFCFHNLLYLELGNILFVSDCLLYLRFEF